MHYKNLVYIFVLLENDIAIYIGFFTIIHLYIYTYIKYTLFYVYIYLHVAGYWMNCLNKLCIPKILKGF